MDVSGAPQSLGTCHRFLQRGYLSVPCHGVFQLPPCTLHITRTFLCCPGLAGEDQPLQIPMPPLRMLCFPKVDPLEVAKHFVLSAVTTGKVLAPSSSPSGVHS